MMCFGGIGLAALIALRRWRRQRHVCENAEGQIVGLHRSTAIYISATILLFLLEYSLLITSYNTELACHISINSRSSLNHSAIIVDCKGHGRRAHHKNYALRLASCYNKLVRVYIGNKSLADSIFESPRRLLCWSGQQKTKVLASLKAGVH